MMDFTPQQCLCTVADCGKCLTLGCTDNGCKAHRLVTKWRYRKGLLDRLMGNVGKEQDKEKLATLQTEIETCKKEVERLSEAMNHPVK